MASRLMRVRSAVFPVLAVWRSVKTVEVGTLVGVA